MNVTISASDSDMRMWKYLLRKKYGSRKGLKCLVKLAVLDAVASVAREELLGLEAELEDSQMGTYVE